MASPAAPLSTAESSAARPHGPAERKSLRWFEVCLVLFFAFGTNFYNSLYLLIHGPTAELRTTAARATFGLLHEIMALALLGYVLARRGRRFSDIGLRWSLRDLGVGVAVLVAFVAAAVVGAVSIYFLHIRIFGTAPVPHRASEFFGHFSIPIAPYFLVGPVLEELVVRAYLMTEIRELTGSAALAVVASTLVQTSYHLYYGWWIALSLGCSFFVLSLYYARSRRALPLIVAHELFDLQGLFHL